MLIGLGVAGVLAVGAAVVVVPRFLHPPTTATPTPEVSTPTFPVPAGMAFIDGGVFNEGREPYGVEDAADVPAHSVTVKPFAIGRREVTLNEFHEYLTKQSLPWPPTITGMTDPILAIVGPKSVSNVTQKDAGAYCAWKYPGGRLPSEAEWEWAARGKDGWLFPWGEGFRPDCVNGGEPAPGASRLLEPPNKHPCGQTPSGLFDMAGNVREWTADPASAYPRSTISLPPASQGAFVARGGSFADTSKNALTTTARAFVSGADRFTGFRCVTSGAP
jgi:formylglycine-generating enzyme required for sulfatase activity